MNELEKALAEYLAKNFRQGAVVAVKRLRDDVASQFITEDLTLSATLSAVRRFVRAMVEAQMLFRVGSGVYTYWPDRDAHETPVSAFDLETARRAPEVAALYPFLRDNAASSFESVETLSRSSRFLVQGNLSEVDLEALQGLSF